MLVMRNCTRGTRETQKCEKCGERDVCRNIELSASRNMLWEDCGPTGWSGTGPRAVAPSGPCRAAFVFQECFLLLFGSLTAAL